MTITHHKFAIIYKLLFHLHVILKRKIPQSGVIADISQIQDLANLGWKDRLIIGLFLLFNFLSKLSLFYQLHYLFIC
ncbi:hypothetical protein V7I55_18665, partial [Acinetobacter baumannii]